MDVINLISSSSSDEEEEEGDNLEITENMGNVQINPHSQTTANSTSMRCLKDSQTGEYYFPDVAIEHRLPGEIGDMLYSYQKQGVAFILQRWHSKPYHGCLLADDMGMGKTIQSVAALTSLFYTAAMQSPPRKLAALIVVPLAVMGQWQVAIERSFSKCYIYHGPQKQRALDRVSSLSGGGVLLSTFDTVSIPDNLQALQRLKWECLIVDEATKIKNYKTTFFKSLRALADCAKFRLALSATPFENNLVEMWALFDFACAGKLFGERAGFEQRFAGKIERGNSKEDAIRRAQMSRALHDVIAPHMLRREKSLFKQQAASQPVERGAAASAASAPIMVVEQMPKFNVNKVDCILWVSLSPLQRSVYQLFLESDEVKQVLNRTQSPLAAINVLRKICHDTRLLPDLTSSSKARTNTTGRANETSNKMRVLLALLKDLCLEKNHKVVVFCNSKAMLDFMESEVEAQLPQRSSSGGGRAFAHLRLDGDFKSEDRAKIIRAFNCDERLLSVKGEKEKKHWDCLFLTTGVGALGIEITGADRVILFEPHWNPAQDDQAVDRCFRLGQEKNVVCFRLITLGTVEEKISEIQLRKSSLARNVLQANKGSSFACKFEINDLFTLEEELDEDELFELFGDNYARNEKQVRLQLANNEKDCNELLSQLEALTNGEGDGSTLLIPLYEDRIVLSASERSVLFQDNTREVEQGLKALTLAERKELDELMQDAKGWVAAGGGEEEEWISAIKS